MKYGNSPELPQNKQLNADDRTAAAHASRFARTEEERQSIKDVARLRALKNRAACLSDDIAAAQEDGTDLDEES